MIAIAVLAAAAGAYTSSTALSVVGLLAGGAFVVTWILYELRPHDPWRKFRRGKAND